MEKLIELLNEYEVEIHWSERERKDWIEWGTLLNQEYRHNENVAYVISKSYWFIKWLVENEKIDKRVQVIKDVETWWNEIKDVVCYDEYESLLMLLSIQDEPIEFLVSILK